MPSVRPLETNKNKVLCLGSFRVVKRGRFWQVQDWDGQLVVTAVYRKGALEVVRRLLPPHLCLLVDACAKRSAPLPRRVRQTARPYDPHQH